MLSTEPWPEISGCLLWATAKRFPPELLPQVRGGRERESRNDSEPSGAGRPPGDDKRPGVSQCKTLVLLPGFASCTGPHSINDPSPTSTLHTSTLSM